MTVNRHDFLLIFDVELGNPNGDPDAGNMPRMDPETGLGLVTDVCLKRKVRDYVAVRHQFQPPNDIFVKHRGILANEQRRAYKAVGAEPGKTPNEKARTWMCANFFDVRAFGAVMTTGKSEEEADKKWNCGQVRGPVQLAFAKSVDQVLPLEHSITRVALTNAGDTGLDTEAEEGEEQKAGSGQFGRKSTIPYGLYVARGFFSPSLAKQTGFSQADLELLWEALVNMFEHDRSAARGMMATRRLVIFEHDSPLGNAPAHQLFDLVRISRRDSGKPARAFSDYDVVLPAQEQMPRGVKIIVKP